MKKVFLDTNVILDFLDDKRAYHTDAKKLLTQLIKDEVEIFISEDMLSTIYYIIKNKELVLEFFETIQDEWNIVPFGQDTIKKAILSCKKSQNQDLEDMLQCICAKENGCDTLFTNDKKFVDCGIEISSYL